MPKKLWIFIILVAAGLVALSIYQALQPGSDAAGWIQVGIASLGVPILLRELIQIREALNQKPIISVAFANVNDLPLSKIRDSVFKTSADVSRGYPRFWLAIRNSGKVSAKSVKIHLAYINPERKSLYLPVIQMDDWLGDARYTFKKVNNADFVFMGGADWVLHAKDTDMFAFHMTTAIVVQEEPEVRARPELGEYEFNCTVWADGLETPLFQKLTVTIVESIRTEQ